MCYTNIKKFQSRIAHWLLPVAICLLLIAACKNSKLKDTAEAKHSGHGDIYYTCSMHPQIMQDKAGNCPICGMQLIKW